jgi:hypothetical protein
MFLMAARPSSTRRKMPELKTQSHKSSLTTPSDYWRSYSSIKTVPPPPSSALPF